jgi:hypothetical protein
MQATHQPTIYDRSRYRAERHALAFLATVKGYQNYRRILLVSNLTPCAQVDMFPRQHSRESVCPDKHSMRRTQVLFILDATSLRGWARTKGGIQALSGEGAKTIVSCFFLRALLIARSVHQMDLRGRVLQSNTNKHR